MSGNLSVYLKKIIPARGPRSDLLSSGHQPRNVRNVCHEQCAHFICDGTEFGEINDSWVCGSPTQDHGRAKHERILSELIKVNQPSLWVHFVWQRFKIDR